MPSFPHGRLAELLGCELLGDSHIEITGVSTIERAGPGEITFLANMKYAPKAKGTRAAAIIAAAPVKESPAATLISANPYHDFARALALYYQPPKPPPGIHPAAVIPPPARRANVTRTSTARSFGLLTLWGQRRKEERAQWLPVIKRLPVMKRLRVIERPAVASARWSASCLGWSPPPRSVYSAAARRRGPPRHRAWPVPRRV